MDGVPVEVRHLVADLVTAELMDAAASMGASADRIKAGAYNAKSASERAFQQGIDLAEAFTHAKMRLADRAAKYRGRYEGSPPRPRGGRAALAPALFDVAAEPAS